jgi:hypothetical protein
MRQVKVWNLQRVAIQVRHVQVRQLGQVKVRLAGEPIHLGHATKMPRDALTRL